MKYRLTEEDAMTTDPTREQPVVRIDTADMTYTWTIDNDLTSPVFEP